MSRRVWPAWLRPADIVDLLRLATPIAVSRASMMLMFLTDTIVLSRNAPGELPYILNSWFPIGICMGISIGLLLGVSILTAEFSGRGEASQTGRIFRRGVGISFAFGGFSMIAVMIVVGPLFAALGFEGEVLEGTVSAANILAYGMIAHMLSSAAASYLEALRKPTFVTVAMYVGVVINLVLDLALVGGSWGFPALGADGVALATTGTRWAITIVLLVFIAVATPGFKTSGPAPKGEMKRQLEVGYGMAVSSVAEWGSFNFTFIIATMASLVAGTVYGMVVQTIGFVFMVFLGIGTATSVRAAEHFGAGNMKEAANAGRLGVITTILTGALAGVFMVVFAEQIALVFVRTDDTLNGVELYPLLVSLIAIASVVVMFDGLQNVASMGARALGSVWPPSIIHLGSYAFVMLPLAWWFALGQGKGVYGVMDGVIIASFAAGVLQMIYLEFLSRRISR